MLACSFGTQYMDTVLPFASTQWTTDITSQTQQAATEAIERGQVLHLPDARFELSESEMRFLDPGILGRNKNVSYKPTTDSLGGTICQGNDAQALKAVMRRYAEASHQLTRQLLPHYAETLRLERTSLRPAMVESRVTSWRKDDTRLHIDSFPSSPVQGRRILRIFCNVNPEQRPRKWKIGEPFSDVANRFWPKLQRASALKRHALHLLGITKQTRSEYDHYMVQLHDAMKADDAYQRDAVQQVFDFPAGGAWMCFTDQVSHAAVAGQHQFEQTFTVSVRSMANRETAPLAVLEQLAGRPLAPASA